MENLRGGVGNQPGEELNDTEGKRLLDALHDIISVQVKGSPRIGLIDVPIRLTQRLHRGVSAHSHAALQFDTSIIAADGARNLESNQKDWISKKNQSIGCVIHSIQPAAGGCWRLQILYDERRRRERRGKAYPRGRVRRDSDEWYLVVSSSTGAPATWPPMPFLASFPHLADTFAAGCRTAKTPAPPQITNPFSASSITSNQHSSGNQIINQLLS